MYNFCNENVEKPIVLNSVHSMCKASVLTSRLRVILNVQGSFISTVL